MQYYFWELLEITIRYIGIVWFRQMGNLMIIGVSSQWSSLKYGQNATHRMVLRQTAMKRILATKSTTLP